jgi:DNA-binding GntR family transcriptional regulator
MRAARSKAERVFEALRADILAGRLPPSRRLRYTELCEQYQTSMGVLREGMLRLAEQGLVRGEPQQGFQVVDLSVEDLRDLTDARLDLESLTLRHALTNGDVEWESRLIATHHRLSRTPQLDVDDSQRLSDHWVAAHAEFHHSLLDGCANQRLKDIAGSLRDAAELYRRWSVPLGDGTERNVAFEHAAILAAALARDSDHAVLLLRSHIQHTTNVLLDSFATELSIP